MTILIASVIVAVAILGAAFMFTQQKSSSDEHYVPPVTTPGASRQQVHLSRSRPAFEVGDDWVRPFNPSGGEVKNLED